jgi:hypothetical protein
MLASKYVKIQAVYLPSSRPLFALYLPACISGGHPVFMAGDLKAKHVEWNSRLITKRGSLA